MVVAGTYQAVAQSLLRPLQLSPLCVPSPHPSSRSWHLPSVSSTLLRDNNNYIHSSNGSGSLLYLMHKIRIGSPSSIHLHHRFKPVAALDSELPQPSQLGEEKATLNKNDEAFKQWDWWTAKFAAGANIPFLLLQLPQILLNARNLMAGNKTALLAVSWLGILTGLLGNLSLLSYFAKKKETEAMIVQCLGVITTYVVITQLAMAEAMPFPYFALTSAVVGVGVISNFLNYFGMLPPAIWRFWEDFITVGGLSVLPQVMWSTFVPYIPNIVLPGSIAFVTAIAAVIMWTNFLNPNNIKGLSAISMLLAMIGNGLMIPRALFIRDFMCFGAGLRVQPGHLFFMAGEISYACTCEFNSISREFFVASTAGLFVWIGLAFWKDSQAYGYSSPLRSLKELVFGS
ncbi:hypothetical protein Cgig2_007735 [Carnegiea gigantea]|uniref:Uncharacterized protein n=1 Tax=Carnegiea gigantea TaxID=171969 RepID=A0A9Q1K8L6_9CARY|nr:hypothetical protein Cgig2_007735 [Carnegiea gigantea]